MGTKEKTYTESEIVKILFEFFEDCDIDGRAQCYSFHDKDARDLLSKFMTVNGFRNSIEKAGLVGKKFNFDEAYEMTSQTKEGEK